MALLPTSKKAFKSITRVRKIGALPQLFESRCPWNFYATSEELFRLESIYPSLKDNERIYAY